MTSGELIHALDFDEMLFKLSKEEHLAFDEIKSLEAYISSTVKGQKEKRSLEDLYAALTVVAKSRLIELSYIVELCLDIHDPLLVSLALETLVIDWDCQENLEQRLIQFVLGVPYDHDEDIKESSIKCIAHILKQKNETINTAEALIRSLNNSLNNIDEKFLSLLLHILDDQEESSYIKKISLEGLQIAFSHIEELEGKTETEFSELLKSYISVSSSYSSSGHSSSNADIISSARVDISETGMR